MKMSVKRGIFSVKDIFCFSSFPVQQPYIHKSFLRIKNSNHNIRLDAKHTNSTDKQNDGSTDSTNDNSTSLYPGHITTSLFQKGILKLRNCLI